MVKKVECLPDLSDRKSVAELQHSVAELQHSVADICRTKGWKNSSGSMADFGNSVTDFGLTDNFKNQFQSVFFTQ